MFAQVKMFPRTVSVAVRVPGRESSRGHGHIADSVAAPKILLSDASLATLRTLGTQNARSIEGLSRAAINRLATEIVPRSLTGPEHPAPRALTIVPDGP